MFDKAHVVKKMKLHFHKSSAEQKYLSVNRERFKITRIGGVEHQSILKSKQQQLFSKLNISSISKMKRCIYPNYALN